MELLILCCFGGLPFIQFPQQEQQRRLPQQLRHQWDPTDWVATDQSGSLLNASSNSAFLAANPSLASLLPSQLPGDLSLEQCDLWNLTFASAADEHLFRRSRGQLKCRCPTEFTGSACQLRENVTLPRSQDNTVTVPSKKLPNPSERMPSTPSTLLAIAPTALALESPTSAARPIVENANSFGLFLVLFMLLAGAMVAAFMMLRGCCFCDCFGGLGRSSARRYEQPLDPQTVNQCLVAVRAHEEEEKRRWAQHGQWTAAPPPAASSLVIDSRRPLLPQGPVPSVSESVPMPMAPPRSCSPPPSYRSLNTSLERLPDALSTKI